MLSISKTTQSDDHDDLRVPKTSLSLGQIAVIKAVGGLSPLADRTAFERITAAGATPNTSFALVTELFRVWNSPAAGEAREIIKAYLEEAEEFTTP